MMEKYELFRQRNELLAKKAFDKESLYVQIRHENDELAGESYTETRQSNAILETLKTVWAISNGNWATWKSKPALHSKSWTAAPKRMTIRFRCLRIRSSALHFTKRKRSQSTHWLMSKKRIEDGQSEESKIVRDKVTDEEAIAEYKSFYNSIERVTSV
jgi:hypothetical protein